MRHCGDWPTARLKHACLWNGSSSCSSNCPVLVPSQHLVIYSRDWTFQLCCWNVLWYSSELQCYRVLAGSQDWHWFDFSPSVTGVCWTPVQHMWRLTAGKRNRMAKNLERHVFSQNELEVHLIMWTRWAVVECFILTTDFNSDRYDSEPMMMIMMMTTITSNSVSVLYTALLLLLVSNNK